MPTVTTDVVVDRELADAAVSPRDDLVLEREAGAGRFELLDGPFLSLIHI